MRKFLYHLSLLLVFVLALLSCVLYVHPIIYTKVQSSLSRYKTINEYLNDSKSPEVIFFGDSRGMFGIDANLIKEKCKLDGGVYNLSSPNQDLFESSYFYSKVPNCVRLVVQTVDVGFFNSNKNHNLSPEHSIAMSLSGYSLDSDTKRLINSDFRLLDKNVISRSF